MSETPEAEGEQHREERRSLVSKERRAFRKGPGRREQGNAGPPSDPPEPAGFVDGDESAGL